MLKKFVLVLITLVTAVPALAQAPNPSTVGRYEFVKGEVSKDNSAITLPLYKGSLKDGSLVWYILTDVSDQALALKWGINYATVLAASKGQTRMAVRLSTSSPRWPSAAAGNTG